MKELLLEFQKAIKQSSPQYHVKSVTSYKEGYRFFMVQRDGLLSVKTEVRLTSLSQEVCSFQILFKTSAQFPTSIPGIKFEYSDELKNPSVQKLSECFVEAAQMFFRKIKNIVSQKVFN